MRGPRLCAVVSVVCAIAQAQDCAWQGAVRPGPSARHSHAMAYDSARGVTVSFGGFDGDQQTGQLLGDTWEFDGDRWRAVASGGPSARLGAAMAYDARRGVCVLFGGNDGAYRNDTWEWDGATWRNVASAGPGVRGRHALAYDVARGVTVLFGGMPRGGDETWEWNGSTWTRFAVVGPSPRNRHAMAYDSARNRTVLFGGRDDANNLSGDTWEWNGAAWTQVATTGPAARSRHALVFDDARGVCVLFGGNRGPYLDDTWEWDGATWRQVAVTGPARRQYHALAYDRGRRITVLFGGFDGITALGDTSEFACCQAPGSFGCATPHCSGAAVLSAVSCPRVGNAQFRLDIGNAVPDLPPPGVCVVLASNAAATTTLPCASTVATQLCLNVVPIGIGFVVAIDAAGNGALPVPIPSSAALRGGRVWFQLVNQHPGRDCGCVVAPGLELTASRGLSITVQ